MNYIFGAKPGDHKALFESVEGSEETEYHEILDERGFLHQFRYLNNVALNKSNPDGRVNFLEYMQTDPKGKESRFSLDTNIWITQKNIFMIMRGGRARWKVENETFNTQVATLFFSMEKRAFQIRDLRGKQGVYTLVTIKAKKVRSVACIEEIWGGNLGV